MTCVQPVETESSAHKFQPGEIRCLHHHHIDPTPTVSYQVSSRENIDPGNSASSIRLPPAQFRRVIIHGATEFCTGHISIFPLWELKNSTFLHPRDGVLIRADCYDVVEKVVARASPITNSMNAFRYTYLPLSPTLDLVK